MARPRKAGNYGASIGKVAISTKNGATAQKYNTPAAREAFGEANKELARMLQQVAFLRVSNTLKKSRAKGRATYNWGKARDGRGIRAALRDPDMSRPANGDWSRGLIVGNEAIFARYGARDYWRTIESGGGPVGRWFPNYVLGLDGQAVPGPRTARAESARTSNYKRVRDYNRAKSSGSPTALGSVRDRYRAEDVAIERTRGRAQKNWQANGAVMAEGVLARNGYGGSSRGSIVKQTRNADGTKRGYFQVKKAILAVHYMRAMRAKAFEWKNDGTIVNLYVAKLAEKGIRMAPSARRKVSALYGYSKAPFTGGDGWQG